MVAEEDLECSALEIGEIEAAGKLQYLGSLIESSGSMDVDIDKWVAGASRAFGALRMAIFLD